MGNILDLFHEYFHYIMDYQAMSPSDFLIVADYNELVNDSSARCNVYLRRQPDGIQRVKMQLQQVDYLIEEELRR